MPSVSPKGRQFLRLYALLGVPSIDTVPPPSTFAQVHHHAVIDRLLEAVDVHDRDEQHPALLEQAGDAGIAGVDAVDQVVGELHGVLTGGPFTGVVQAHEQERRAFVVGTFDADGDLEAVDGLALDALVGELEQPDEAGVGLGEGLHLGVVVLEGPVGVAARRQGGGADRGGVGPVHLLDLGFATVQVGDPDLERQAERFEYRQVGRAVEDDLDVVVADVLGDVEAGVGNDVPLGEVGGDRDQPGREGRVERVRRDGAVRDGQRIRGGEQGEAEGGGRAGRERNATRGSCGGHGSFGVAGGRTRTCSPTIWPLPAPNASLPVGNRANCAQSASEGAGCPAVSRWVRTVSVGLLAPRPVPPRAP